jgi:hypothetical protein
MRPLLLLLFLTLPLFPQSPDETAALATVQKTFDAMKAHDEAAIKALFLSDARLYAIRDNVPGPSRAADDFAAQIAALKGDLLERFTAKPHILIRGRMAQVWGEYEFLRDGKFAHCGVDSVSLFKTAEGWKIASLSFTMETTGCPGR